MRIELAGVGKDFRRRGRRITAVRSVDLVIEDGELFVFLGPSGCGKSTLLNLVAGLEEPSRGTIRFDSREVAAAADGVFVPPRDRDVAMVFQSYALYPHLTAYENVAFPLRVAGVRGVEVDRAVRRASGTLGIEGLLEARPAELSGGQRQRVAIARALVREPAVFLLDEPLSNLDAQLRASTRVELKNLQRRLGITTLYVTHDQVEAMTLGDRIAVLRDGGVEQIGGAEELYRAPVNPFVARFVGSPQMNLLEASIERSQDPLALRLDGRRFVVPAARRDAVLAVGDDRCLLGIRPEHLRLVAAESSANESAARGAESAPAHDAAVPAAPSGPLDLGWGEVEAVEPLGREVLVHVRFAQQRLAVLAEVDLKVGARVALACDGEHLHVFPLES
jgi:multiple sugar transport system ATP-binding protein